MTGRGAVGGPVVRARTSESADGRHVDEPVVAGVTRPRQRCRALGVVLGDRQVDDWRQLGIEWVFALGVVAAACQQCQEGDDAGLRANRPSIDG